MPSSRFLASATLIALSLGATVGAATAGAAPVEPSPTATPSATATATATTEPSATAGPSATGTPTPTGTPTLPEGCLKQRDVALPLHVYPDTTPTVVKGGSAQDVYVSVNNTSKVPLTDYRITFRIQGPKGSAKLKVQAQTQGEPFKPVKQDPAGGPASVGSFRIPSHENFTVGLRISADAGAALGDYSLAVDGVSEVLPPGSGPEDVKDTCNRLTGSYAGKLTVADKAPATPTASGSPTATTTTAPTATTKPTATPTASASPTASPTASASPSATSAAGTTGTTGGGTGPAATRLADTGASAGTKPLAVTGAAAIALGATTLLVTRRRKAARD
ncbi:hypothetical protein ABTX81_10375 [Kitasatospora sp. NPDC097605]|uniref:hypothetical protein n=1 Tax=Kitasatospora sp. NPDC097605 TaxID=3157226 RepID=UPI003325F7B8